MLNCVHDGLDTSNIIMSHSRRHTPVAGFSTAKSDKKGKQSASRVERRVVNETLQRNPTAEILPHKHELSDPWSMPKDGKRRFDPAQHPKTMRK